VPAAPGLAAACVVPAAAAVDGHVAQQCCCLQAQYITAWAHHNSGLFAVTWSMVGFAYLIILN
jgi:hypothetical protein